MRVGADRVAVADAGRLGLGFPVEAGLAGGPVAAIETALLGLARRLGVAQAGEQELRVVLLGGLGLDARALVQQEAAQGLASSSPRRARARSASVCCALGAAAQLRFQVPRVPPRPGAGALDRGGRRRRWIAQRLLETREGGLLAALGQGPQRRGRAAPGLGPERRDGDDLLVQARGAWAVEGEAAEQHDAGLGAAASDDAGALQAGLEALAEEARQQAAHQPVLQVELHDVVRVGAVRADRRGGRRARRTGAARAPLAAAARRRPRRGERRSSKASAQAAPAKAGSAGSRRKSARAAHLAAARGVERRVRPARARSRRRAPARPAATPTRSGSAPAALAGRPARAPGGAGGAASASSISPAAVAPAASAALGLDRRRPGLRRPRCRSRARRSVRRAAIDLACGAELLADALGLPHERVEHDVLLAAGRARSSGTTPWARAAACGRCARCAAPAAPGSRAGPRGSGRGSGTAG